jgi:hypothetical protein
VHRPPTRQAAAVLTLGGWALPNTGNTVPTYSGLHLVPGPPLNPSAERRAVDISQSGGSDESRGRTWASWLTATPACGVVGHAFHD